MSPSPSASELLAGRGFELLRDALGRLAVVDADGRRYDNVEVYRAFPISAEDGWISICDAEGHEILWIREWQALSPAQRTILKEELSRREFVPVIERILRVDADADPSEWEVETDRGPVSFLLDSEDDVRRLPDSAALVLDTHGIRYLIPDTRQLDAASRRILERYL